MTPNTNRTAPAGHALNAAECFPRCQREGEHVFTRTDACKRNPPIASKAQPDAGSLAEPTQGQHTPGPWIFDAKDLGEFRDAMFGIYPERGGAVACIPATRAHAGGDWDALAEESRVNARLIAAAPDLLAALEALVGSAGASHTSKADLWGDARAAIAKARA